MSDHENVWQKIAKLDQVVVDIDNLEIDSALIKGFTDEVESEARRLQKDEDVLFVSKNGDNSDGLTWDTSFLTLVDAVAAAASDRVTRITVGKGIFICPTHDGFIINKPVHIIGSGVGQTIFRNTSTWDISQFIMHIHVTSQIEQCGFERVGKTVGGIMIYGADANKSIIEKCLFEFDGNDNHNNIIRVESTHRNIIRDIKMVGANPNSIGINMSGGSYNTFSNISITNCLVGIRIAAGVEKTTVMDINFTKCGTNIDDLSPSTGLHGISSEFLNSIYPEDLTGITLPNSGEIAVYGANTPIIPADLLDTPFRILAYTAAPDDDKTFIIRLSRDGGVSHFMHMLERRDGLNGELSRILVLNDTIFPRGTEISGSIMSEVTDESCEIWLYYQRI